MSEGSNIVKWGDYNLDEAEKELEDLEKSGGAEFMKLGVGKNIVRFLPPALGKKSPFRVIHEHFIKRPHGDVRFTCPRMEVKKPCIVCAKADKLKATGQDSDFELAKDLFPKRRVYANVIDRAHPDSGPKVLAFGKMIHEDLIKLRKNEDWGGDFTHPETGFDVVIERKGSGKNDTEYTVSPRKQTKLENFDWIQMQHDLERYAKVLTEEQIREKLAGKQEDGTAKPATKDAGGNRRAEPAVAKGRTVDDVMDGEIIDSTAKKASEGDDDIPF